MRAKAVLWAARATLIFVFLGNLQCALSFLLDPWSYVPGFEIGGVGGRTAVQGIGILMLMWQVPYIPAIWHPRQHRLCFACVIAMQVIGLVGETALLLTLPPGHQSLRATGMRFIAFDGLGLLLMLGAFALLKRKT